MNRNRSSGLVGLLVLASALLAGPTPCTPWALAQDNGIFADFNTSLGGFTCQLHYTAAPKAVANFIGLATGQRAWFDQPNGRIRTNAFFEGLIFHRVVAGFMIQGGSPTGSGSGGPGYAFPDEFDPTLRHDGPGVLSMANSGPRSNGSQFFITVAATPMLNDVHTIFGRVTMGQTVVDAISQVATNQSSRPLTNVVIQSVAIRRVGAEANAFDIQAQDLPVVSPAPLAIAGGTGDVTLSYSNRQYTAQFLSLSTNLVSWTASSLGIQLSPSEPASLTGATDVPARFFTLSHVQYPSSTFSPRNLSDRTLTLNFNGGIGTVTILFDAAEGGTYTYSNGNPGTINDYSWTQEPYRGFLWPIYFSGLVTMTLRLDFSTETAGAFSGTAYTVEPMGVSGVFSLSQP